MHKILKTLKILEGLIHTLYMELIVKYGNCMQNTEKNGCNILKINVSKQIGGTVNA